VVNKYIHKIKANKLLDEKRCLWISCCKNIVVTCCLCFFGGWGVGGGLLGGEGQLNVICCDVCHTGFLFFFLFS
jgi:hypothetical protein